MNIILNITVITLLLTIAALLMKAEIRPSSEGKISMFKSTKKYTQKNGPYPVYQPGDKMPKGMFPPIETHTHYIIVGLIISSHIDAFLEKHDITGTLARETKNGINSAIIAEFEADYMEYSLAKYYLMKYNDENNVTRNLSMDDLAGHYAVMAHRSALNSLKGSPLASRDDDFLLELMTIVGDPVQDHILILKDDAKLAAFRTQYADVLEGQLEFVKRVGQSQ